MEFYSDRAIQYEQNVILMLLTLEQYSIHLPL